MLYCFSHLAWPTEAQDTQKFGTSVPKVWDGRRLQKWSEHHNLFERTKGSSELMAFCAIHVGP